MKNLKAQFRSILALVGITFVAAGCMGNTNSGTRNELTPMSDEAARISIMTFNAENLFDAVHDQDREDFTYLPLAVKKANPEIMKGCEKMGSDFYKEECRTLDWNDDVVETKLNAVAGVVKQINAGSGPDILVLVEIENKNILDMLNDRKLKNLGYKTSVLLEGPDTRGIDTGVLSRFEQWDAPKMHIIQFKLKDKRDEHAAKTTRGILETRLVLPGGQKASIFSVHFPSQSNPSYLRLQAIEFLNKLKTELPKDVVAISAGDFNVTSIEDNKTGYYTNVLATEWQVSHQEGCKDCKGSYYYHSDRSWSWFDLVNFAPSADGKSKWKMDRASVQTPNEAPGQRKDRFVEPLRFDPRSGKGVSDHWPMYLELYLQK